MGKKLPGACVPIVGLYIWVPVLLWKLLLGLLDLLLLLGLVGTACALLWGAGWCVGKLFERRDNPCCSVPPEEVDNVIRLADYT